MKIRGGVNLLQRPPVFSADGKLLLVATGCNISVYSVSSCLLVNQLEGHTGQVTSINVAHYSGAAKSERNHIWTTSLDGTVRLWDVSRGTSITCLNVGKPIYSMVTPKTTTESEASSKQCFGLLLVKWNADDKDVKWRTRDGGSEKANHTDALHFRVVILDLKNGKLLPQYLAKVNAPHLLISSRSGGLVGMLSKHKIWTWRVSSKGIHGVKSFDTILLHHASDLQCLAFDPTETVVASSDSAGRILIWKNVGERSYLSKQQKDLVTTKDKFDLNSGACGSDDAAALSSYHWHHTSVNFLTFSADGAYLFSGGKENVFVMYQLETGKMQFIPRLGSTLLHCASSVDASLYSVSCADNSIKLIDIGTMVVKRSISGIKPAVSLSSDHSDIVKVKMQPGTGSLVLPSEFMSVQFYDAFHDRQVGEVCVSYRNYTHVDGRKRKEKTVRGVYISHVAFSKDGSIMVTSECHIGEENIGGGSILKFWDRKNLNTHYSLTTQIDEPHVGEILCLVYHPSLDMSVSCSNPGEFKVWIQEKIGDGKQVAPRWRCRSVGSYQQRSMQSAAFSSDGTVLAVAAEELITLWNPSTNGLLHVLAGNFKNPVQMLYFSPRTEHLIAASKGQQPELIVWSLETLSICWSYHVEVQAIAVDCSSNQFAILAASGKSTIDKKKTDGKSEGCIVIFDVRSPSPCAIWDTQEARGNIIYCSDPSDKRSSDTLDTKDMPSKQSHLVYLNSNREYLMFDPSTKDDEPEASPEAKFQKAASKEGPTAFEAAFGMALDPPLKIVGGVSQTKGSQPARKLVDCPSHLISLTNIGCSYIESLLEKRAANTTVS